MKRNLRLVRQLGDGTKRKHRVNSSAGNASPPSGVRDKQVPSQGLRLVPTRALGVVSEVQRREQKLREARSALIEIEGSDSLIRYFGLDGSAAERPEFVRQGTEELCSELRELSERLEILESEAVELRDRMADFSESLPLDPEVLRSLRSKPGKKG